MFKKPSAEETIGWTEARGGTDRQAEWKKGDISVIYSRTGWSADGYKHAPTTRPFAARNEEHGILRSPGGRVRVFGSFAGAAKAAEAAVGCRLHGDPVLDPSALLSLARIVSKCDQRCVTLAAIRRHSLEADFERARRAGLLMSAGFETSGYADNWLASDDGRQAVVEASRHGSTRLEGEIDPSPEMW